MQSKESFPCKECSKIFSSKGNLKVHVSTIHENSVFICPKCGQNFNRKSSLVRHTHKCGEKEYNCEVCDKKFEKKSHLICSSSTDKK